MPYWYIDTGFATLLILLAVGYPDPAAGPVPPARPSDRKPLTELVHRGRW